MCKREEHSAAFIIGFSDGLVLPVVVITALTRLTENNDTLLQACSIFILLFSAVMGLSHYYTKRNHTDISIKTETFQSIGLSEDLEQQLLKDHEQEKQEWENVLEENEFMSNNSYAASWITGIAYLLSGIALLIPFLILSIQQAYKISCIICGLLMLLFGFLKARVTGNHPVRVIFRNLFNAAALSGLVHIVAGLIAQ